MNEKFFQGVPCSVCACTMRYIRDKKCVMCCRTRDRARYAKRRPQQKSYYDANKERIRASARVHGKKKHAKDPRYKMLSSAKLRANMYGRLFSITLDDIVIPKACPLLGIEIITGSRQVKNNSPTLDRKDSSQGYTPANVWVISWRANRIKADATKEEMALILKNWP